MYSYETHISFSHGTDSTKLTHKYPNCTQGSDTIRHTYTHFFVLAFIVPFVIKLSRFHRPSIFLRDSIMVYEFAPPICYPLYALVMTFLLLHIIPSYRKFHYAYRKTYA